VRDKHQKVRIGVERRDFVERDLRARRVRVHRRVGEIGEG
jgi:hypothetical protein